MALDVRPGPRLSDRTTLRLGGHALAEVVLTSPEDAAGLAETLAGLGGTPLTLGGGSNLLIRDGQLPLVVVSPRLTGEPETLRQRFGAAVRVRVGAGVKLQRLVAWLATQGLAGLAGLVGVPGTVGGAVAGNAGSYGCDMGSVLARCWSGPLEGVSSGSVARTLRPVTGISASRRPGNRFWCWRPRSTARWTNPSTSGGP